MSAQKRSAANTPMGSDEDDDDNNQPQLEQSGLVDKFFICLILLNISSLCFYRRLLIVLDSDGSRSSSPGGDKDEYDFCHVYFQVSSLLLLI